MQLTLGDTLFLAVKSFVLLWCSLFALEESDLKISHDVLKHDDIGNYLNYFSRAPGPFKTLVTSNPMQVYVYAKAAEDAIRQYNDKKQVEYRLRGIVSYQEISKTMVSFTLRVRASYGGELINGRFYMRQSSENNNQRFNLISAVLPLASTNTTCEKISREANCTQCDDYGHCLKGKVPLDPWLAYALKTQREIQINQNFTQVQFFSAHNAFNNRVDNHGVADNCPWPPPYPAACICIANQEFSFTDLLNMGYHALEIDPWWCLGKMRMSHATGHAFGCTPYDITFEDGIMEIGQWVHRPENQGKIIRFYFEDDNGKSQGHDDLINGPIKQYLGDKVFTPFDKNAIFGGKWPTVGQLRNINKTVIITNWGTYTHGGLYIHDGYWEDYSVKEFTPYPECGGKNSSNILRFNCDSTKYGPFWNGPKETGIILDFTEYVKCRIQYPAADQVSPSLLKTGIFTWAEGQPAEPLKNTSCVFLDGSLHRWKVASDCSTQLLSACVNRTDSEHWTITETPGPYNSTMCPAGFLFGLPINGFQQQKIVEEVKGRSVWINLTPYIHLLT